MSKIFTIQKDAYNSSQDDVLKSSQENTSDPSSDHIISASRNTNQPSIKNIIIGGSGTAGYCYIGALRELFDGTNRNLANVKNFIGTSIGSVIAAIISCTDDQDYMMEKFASFDISNLQDNTCGVMVDLYRLYSKFGYNKGEYALKIARDIMADLTGNSKITFAEHYEITTNNLIITGVNTSTRHVTYFNRITHPNMEVAIAIRISMSIPLIFVPIEYTNELYTDILGTTAKFVDGGMIDNYPFHFIFTDLFNLLNTDSTNSHNPAKIEDALKELYHLNGEQNDIISDDIKAKHLAETIGIKTYTRATLSMLSPESHISDTDNIKFNIESYCSTLISILMDNGLKQHISSDIWDRTVKINIGDRSTIDFNIEQHDIDDMMRIGKNAGILFNSGC